MLLTKLWSEPPSFEPITFTSGLNIILAHVTDQARKVSGAGRNGAGKTTFARIVDFCLLDPAPLPADAIFKSYTFFLEFVHEGHRYTVARSGQNPRLAAFARDDDALKTYSLSELRDRLGMLVFGLPPGSGPINFNTIVSYLIRSETEGYLDLFRPVPVGKSIWQAATLFLMGLDHRLPSRLAELRKRQEAVHQTHKALQMHLVSRGHPQPIEVGLELQRAREQLHERQQQLASYRVAQEYRHLADEALILSKDIKRLANEKYLARRRIDGYLNLLKRPTTAQADVDSALELFDEMSVVLPGQVKRTLEEVIAFQGALAENRRRFLEREVSSLRARLEDIDLELTKADADRQRVMGALKAHGELEPYDDATTALALLREKIAHLESQQMLFADIEKQNRRLTELQAQLERLALESNLHVLKHRDTIELLTNSFAGLYARLYGHPAWLSVKIEKDFEFRVHGAGWELESSGRYRTAIFCFDFTLLLHNYARQPCSHWLLHDGVFKGVDSSKVAAALTIASELPEGLQYICTVNSDNLPPGVDYRSYIRREISDAPAELTFMRRAF